MPTADDAIQGAQDIIAEKISQTPECRALIHDFYGNRLLDVKGVGDEQAQKLPFIKCTGNIARR